MKYISSLEDSKLEKIDTDFGIENIYEIKSETYKEIIINMIYYNIFKRFDLL